MHSQYRLRPEAACRLPSAVCLLYEKRFALRKIDSHRVPDFTQQLGRDLAQPALARPVLHALCDDTTHERRNSIEPYGRGLRPDERRSEVRSIGDADRFDELRSLTRFIDP